MADGNSSKRSLVDVATLKERLEYFPETGRFVWLVNYGRSCPGAEAGSIYDDRRGRGQGQGRGRYRFIRLCGMKYRAHRLAWFYMTGRWPTDEIDHIDGDGTNNAWDNLREATHAENCANMPIRRTNKAGLKGVHWCNKSRMYISSIKVLGKSIRLGRFDTAEAAHSAYVEAAHHYHREFANCRNVAVI